MIQELRGLVVRVTDVSEFDRMLTLLTAENGIVSVFVRGAKRTSSRFLAASQLFCYGDYTAFKGKSAAYTLDDCTVIESFFNLRNDLMTLALGTYFCEVSADVCLEGQDEHSMLQLTLNALWCIEKNEKPLYLIKGAFEFRCACIIGFLPQLGACQTCGAVLGEHKMVFDVLNGILLCDKCHAKLPLPKSPYEDDKTVICRTVSNSTVAALRYIITTPAQKQFSFQLDPTVKTEFAEICELYLLTQVGHGYHALTFYKTVME